MSDDFLRLIPADPEFVPDPDVGERARDRLARMVPAAETVTVTTSGEPGFVDPGPDLHSARCPLCGGELDIDWVVDAISEVFELTRFRELTVATPCCGGRASLNELEYAPPAGFARFLLEARNPNVRDLSPEQLDELASLVGAPLRRIWTHL